MGILLENPRRRGRRRSRKGRMPAALKRYWAGRRSNPSRGRRRRRASSRRRSRRSNPVRRSRRRSSGRRRSYRRSRRSNPFRIPGLSSGVMGAVRTGAIYYGSLLGLQFANAVTAKYVDPLLAKVLPAKVNPALVKYPVLGIVAGMVATKVRILRPFAAPLRVVGMLWGAWLGLPWTGQAIAQKSGLADYLPDERSYGMLGDYARTSDLRGLGADLYDYAAETYTGLPEQT